MYIYIYIYTYIYIYMYSCSCYSDIPLTKMLILLWIQLCSYICA